MRKTSTNLNAARRWIVLLIGAVGAGLWDPQGARAADEGDRFTLRLTPYAWLAGTTGDVTVKGQEASIDACFTEIVNDSDTVFGLAARVEGRKGRLGFYVDGVYMNVGVNSVPTPAGDRVDVTNDIGIVDFGLILGLGSWSVGNEGASKNFTVDALVGGRYMYVGLDLDFDIQPDADGSKSWVDPIIGLQAEWDISRHWAVLVRGDVGGFGAASDFTWSAAGYIAYVFPIGKKVQGAMSIGYKAIGDDYSTGSGSNKFEWDVVLHGPVIGFTFQF